MQQEMLPFDRDKTIQERFELFIAEHPDVMEAFRKMASQRRSADRGEAGREPGR